MLSGSVAAATSPLNVSSSSAVSPVRRASPQHSCTQDSIQTGTLTMRESVRITYRWPSVAGRRGGIATFNSRLIEAHVIQGWLTYGLRC